MNVGYKDSPLGKIPSDWELVTVKEITKEHKQGFYTKDGYVDEGIRLARITDLNNPKVDYSEMPKLNISDSDFQSYKIQKGDFLFARSGAIGRYGIVENEEFPAIFASYLIRFRFSNDIVNRFFGYFFESYLCGNQLRAITQGNANVNINAENIKSLKFPHAPLPEQQKIAEILSTVDAKIEVIDRQITETQALKKGLMQRLLTKGIGHTEFKDSALGEIPSGWDLKTLKEVSKFSNGKGHEQAIDQHGDYIVVNSKFISTNGLVKKFSNENLSPLYKGDIAMVMSDIPNGKAIAKCFIVDQDNKYTLNQRICSIKPDNNFNYKFLYYVINRNRYYLDFDNGVSQTNLRKDEVLDCPIQSPPIDEQNKIAEILSSIDEKLEILSEKKTYYQELKQGLMQQLLTGKIRVKV